MAQHPRTDLAMPKTVGELHTSFSIEIRCRRCGRIAKIDPAKLTTKGGRAIDRRMSLPDFLAKLTCTEKACGEKPIQLHVGFRTPGAPGEPPHPMHRWPGSLPPHIKPAQVKLMDLPKMLKCSWCQRKSPRTEVFVLSR